MHRYVSLLAKLVPRSDFFSKCFVIWECSRYLCPEARRMIVFNSVAELVHDYVVGKLVGEERDAVIEREVVPVRATSPPRLLITDGNTTIYGSKFFIKKFKT